MSTNLPGSLFTTPRRHDMTSTTSMHTRLGAWFDAHIQNQDHASRALSLWEEYDRASQDRAREEDVALLGSALLGLVGQDVDELAMRHDLDPAKLGALTSRIRAQVDLSPFDPRYAPSSPRTNPMMQQLAGLLFEVCERSHDPLDVTMELPQIATTWTLLELELGGERAGEVLVSLVDNHTRFVLDQRLVDAGEFSIKGAVDLLVSVMQRSGIRPDDVMIQGKDKARELGERLERVEIAWSQTDGAHLDALTQTFAERFSEAEELHVYFQDAHERLPANIVEFHARTTRFWELECWEKLGPEVMLDVSNKDRSWLLNVLDARSGRLGFTLFDASEGTSSQVGAQRIVSLVDCAHIARPALAALASAELSPIGEDYFAMLVGEDGEDFEEEDFETASSLCHALNAYVEAALPSLDFEQPELGTLHIRRAE